MVKRTAKTLLTLRDVARAMGHSMYLIRRLDKEGALPPPVSIQKSNKDTMIRYWTIRQIADWTGVPSETLWRTLHNAY